MIKVAVSGSLGRMGKMIIELAGEDRKLTVSGTFDKDDSPESAIKNSDVLVDFTTPAATIKNLRIAQENKKAVVIGTTGLSDEQKNAIKDASKSIPIVFSPNMSIGVNLLFKLAKEAAAALDESYKASLSETHHVHKKDAPSGTAKKLAEIIALTRKISQADVDVKSKREGEVVGDHAVVFDGHEERIELSHSAKTRRVFAKGAIEAAKFVAGKKPKLYDMFDVLGLK